MLSSGTQRQSAGILLYRRNPDLQVFLVHPGGPFWAKKDAGVWSIPKGEFVDEDPLIAAQREFAEETGTSVAGQFTPLSSIRLKSGKVIYAWAVEGDLDPSRLKSNTFILFGKPYPEVDRGEWFTLDIAKIKIHPSQAGFLTQLPP